MDPRRQGQFVHAVFEDFFREWQAARPRRDHARQPGRSARACSRRSSIGSLARERSRTRKRALERTRLLGSPAAAGLGRSGLPDGGRAPGAGRRAPARVHRQRRADRRPRAAGTRSVALRGKADRIDLLDDGTFRLIDYKLGWPPDRARALQLPIYASVCGAAAGRTTAAGGTCWARRRTSPSRGRGASCRCSRRRRSACDVLNKAQERLSSALDAIGRGEFPPTPDDVYRCETCSFAAVAGRTMSEPC